MSFYDYDNQTGIKLLCGVDEAGRGPLAGPVFAAAVILNRENFIDGINDSKKLTPKKREFLYEEIINNAVSYSIESVDVQTVDEINILQATFLAMKKAVLDLHIKPGLVMIDGNKNPDVGIHSRCVVNGDSISASIAAASILAKVERDRYMLKVHEKYPEYGFDKHKGYGTALHVEMIMKYGPSPVHRKTFLKNILKEKAGSQEKGNGTKKKGKRGEQIAENILLQKGCNILCKNYAASFGEIDIIAQDKDMIVFTEVKARTSKMLYTPREAVTAQKIKKIIKTAYTYIQETGCKLQPRFDVIEIYLSETPVRVNHIENAFEEDFRI